MRIDKVYIKQFKNLIKFNIDLNENEMKTVLLGQNATGKSNFIEALVLIFKYLDLKEEPPQKLELQYRIEYICREKKIIVEYLTGKYVFEVWNPTIIKGKKGWVKNITNPVTKTEFFRSKEQYLPKYVFTYYSGISNRLKSHFDEHQKKFYDKIIKKDFRDTEIDSLRKLFYVQSVHSHFVLLAYYSFSKQEKESIQFLKKTLGIQDLDSVLFVIKKPSGNWKGDVRFFGAEGLVSKFLENVWDLSLAPIYEDKRVAIDFRSEETQKR